MQWWWRFFQAINDKTSDTIYTFAPWGAPTHINSCENIMRKLIPLFFYYYRIMKVSKTSDKD